MNTEDRIAKIERTFLGWEDHGIFTAMLHVTYGGTAQGIGGYALDAPARDATGKWLGRKGTAYGMEFIRRTLSACGVNEWEKLNGRTIIVVAEPGLNGRVLGIKPLPTEQGTPFMFSDLEGYTGPRSVAEPVG